MTQVFPGSSTAEKRGWSKGTRQKFPKNLQFLAAQATSEKRLNSSMDISGKNVRHFAQQKKAESNHGSSRRKSPTEKTSTKFIRIAKKKEKKRTMWGQGEPNKPFRKMSDEKRAHGKPPKAGRFGTNLRNPP